jgi:regulator of replication initiation timing
MGGAPQAPQRMMTPQLQQQRHGPGPSQQQQMRRPQQQQPPQQQQKMQPQNALPPLPPPNKNAGQLYGIPLHPLIMFQTHDNKLNEHDLMINDCFDQLKEIETRLVVVESSGGGNHPVVTAEPPTSSGAAATDLNELMNDGVFINGIVDNIMTTTNFSSIVENIIPLKEENEMLKRRISDQEVKSEQMHTFIQHLEERLKSIENELAQPYEEFPAPAATTTEAAAETAVEVAETAEAASVAELVAESINEIILSSATASSTASSTLT